MFDYVSLYVLHVFHIFTFLYVPLGLFYFGLFVCFRVFILRAYDMFNKLMIMMMIMMTAFNSSGISRLSSSLETTQPSFLCVLCAGNPVVWLSFYSVFLQYFDIRHLNLLLRTRYALVADVGPSVRCPSRDHIKEHTRYASQPAMVIPVTPFLRSTRPQR